MRCYTPHNVLAAIMLCGLPLLTTAADEVNSSGVVNAPTESAQKTESVPPAAPAPAAVSAPTPEDASAAISAPAPEKVSAAGSESAPEADSAPVPTEPQAEISPTRRDIPAKAKTISNKPEQDVVPNEKEETRPVSPVLSLDSEEQKRSYATGVAMAHYIQDNIARQKALHMTLNRELLLAGMNDTFDNKLKMSESDIQSTLAALEEQVKILTQAAENKKQESAQQFVENFSKREGAKKTSKGLYYIIDNKGTGDALKDTDKVELHYKGTLVDGTVVDGPQIEDANEVFLVANMPPVLSDAVKLIRKGGQITLVIPPGTVKSGAKSDGKSPDNTVLIYTISVVNVIKS